MTQQNVALFVTVIAQMIAAAVLAALLSFFYTRYGKRYLRHWSRSWWLFAAYHLFSGISFALAGWLPATNPARLIAGVSAGVAGYGTIGHLLFGAWELATGRPIRKKKRITILIVLFVIGALASLLYVSSETYAVDRYFVRVGARALALGLALLFAAALIYRASVRKLGFDLLSAAFLLFGLEQLHVFTLAAIWQFTGTYYGYAAWLGFVDFALQSFIGIGMITCLLEDEREASALATKQIEHLAYHDSLTGLPNRAMFFDRLILSIARAGRYGSQVGVLFLDLDRFKEINDSLGHTVGDQLLKAVAERIGSCTREIDSLARFGGDEFTLIIEELTQVDDAARVAQKIIETLRIPYEVGDRELFITTSIGISVYPNDGRDAETLVRNADTAMYRAKEQGRDNYRLYAPAMNERALERLALEQMLRRALSQQELILHYQPLIDVATERVHGAEALVRWNHPELGLLSPAHFISAAEISGLIVPIGEWILRSACRQAVQWQRKLGRSFAVSVNLSARQFAQPDLVEQVDRALKESELDAGCLELEITESNAMQNAENSIHTLRELKGLGVRISMDDFGTGYSSLSYLKRFPIDTLKLDRSFVRDLTIDPDDGAIATAVISMAHSLNLKVTAEGVENLGQFNFLAERRCDRIQGFYFSRPLPPDDFEAFIRKEKERPA